MLGIKCLFTKRTGIISNLILNNIVRTGLKVRPISSTSSRPHRHVESNDEDNFYSSEEKTNYGFQILSEKQKAKKIKTLFDTINDRYELMNQVLSLGADQVWRDIFVHRLRPKANTKLIDMAGGMGDIAFRFLKYKTIRPVTLNGPPSFEHRKISPPQKVPSSGTETHRQEIKDSDCSQEASLRSVLCCDISAKMLEVGRRKAASTLTTDELSRISWLEADGECLSSVPSNTYDIYTVSFGLRNVVRIDRILSEAYRVLRPGGKFMCLELSHVPNPLLKWAYEHYSFQVIPVLGQVLVGDWDNYVYLVESVRKFPDQESLKKMITSAGFKFVSYENLTFGVAAIHTGIKL